MNTPDEDSATPSKQGAASWPMVLVGRDVEGSARVAAAEALSAFRDANTLVKTMPEVAASEFAILEEAQRRAGERSWGRPLTSRGTTLLEANEAVSVQVYGVPTDAGWVCYVAVVEGRRLFVGCDEALVNDFTLHLDQISPRGATYALGLVSDEVVDVALRSGEREYRGVMGRNVFVIRGPRAKDGWAPDEVRLQYASGEVRHVPIS